MILRHRLLIGWIMLSAFVTGCESAHVGAAIPIPGPVKPTVGVSASKKGVKGHGGVSAKVGPVPVRVGGTTKPIKYKNKEVGK